MTTTKKETLCVGIHGYLHEIAGFTDRQTTFTHAQNKNAVYGLQISALVLKIIKFNKKCKLRK